jgi:fucose permease
LKGLSAFDSGVRSIAIALGVGLAASMAAPLTVRYGARTATALGLGVVAAGLALFTTLGVDSVDPQIVVVPFVAALGPPVTGS